MGETAQDVGANRPAADAPGSVRGRSRPVSGRVSGSERITQAVVAVLLAAALGVGLVLEPNEEGVDTHTQLGLPPCGFYLMTGKPCPTCGVTTSFVLAAHGRFAESLANQPFGFLCFVLVVGGLGALVATLGLGRSWAPLLVRTNPVVILVILIIFLLASWTYKWSIM